MEVTQRPRRAVGLDPGQRTVPGGDQEARQLVSIAVGRELAGEGLIGLTRAFHFAGAQSVISSLWRVDDRSTATLMAAFYRHLGDGLEVSDAMRAAQLELLSAAKGESPSYEHPYFWASFQVYG